MKNEERDVYIIPPNFIEGGTLMGGMLKTRNVIEASILGIASGWPVMNLGFSLTTRIIILCLTALPLVLIALIGISGESLSQFIQLFFSWLRNRRKLNGDGTTDGKRKKMMQPSWAKGTKPVSANADDTLKSKNRFQIDFKKRQVEQHKTFLPQEETVKPLNALADYVPIERITNGIIYTRDHRYVKIVEVVPVNFLLRSASEQRSIIYSFMSFVESVSAVRRLSGKWPKAQAKVVENKANGPAIVNLLGKEIPGMVEFNPKGSKEERALSVTPYFEAGNIWFPDPREAPWVEDLIRDLLIFPKGQYKDTVDALVQGILYLMDKPLMTGPPRDLSGLNKESYWRS